MKRRLLVIAICLLLGAVLNVAVAWVSALCVDVYHVGTYKGVTAVTTEEHWTLDTWRCSGAMFIHSLRQRGSVTAAVGETVPPEHLLPYWSELATPSATYASGLSDFEKDIVEARGWPLLALWHELSMTGGQAGLLYSVAGAIETPWRWKSNLRARALPLRPIWLGFATNTLFYGALIWLLIPGLPALRRFLRLRRGLCPTCAYPIGESAVCSECGITLPYRMRMPQADMKRRLLIIAIFLLLGAVVNVAVAWGCAAFAEFDKQASFFVAERPGSSSVPFFVMVHSRSGFGLDQVAYPPTRALDWQRAGLEVQHTRPDLPRWALWPRAPVDKTILYVAAGWPLKALIGRRAGGWIIPLVEHQGPSSRADPPVFISWWSVSRVLPLRPLPLGFAINTVCYAALLWPLICGPSALRRFLRLRRGLCPKCAYPIDEAAVCTECGMALRSPVRVT